MRKGSEKVIPAIVLKYYKTPKKNDSSMPFFKCAWCLELRNRTGGGFIDNKGKTQQICETCAIWQYREDNNFKTIDAAEARRRRIFDVGYLFNESVLDIYLNKQSIANFYYCQNADDVFIKASQLYNDLFSKEDKIRLEDMWSQKDIESEINKRLLSVDLDRFFSDL